MDLDEILYGDDDIEDDFEAILINPVASTISKWRTFIILRMVHLFNQLVGLDEIFYCGNVHKCICTAFLKAFYFPKTNRWKKRNSSRVKPISNKTMEKKGKKQRRRGREVAGKNL
jgi:hypothetical protein